MNKIHITIYVMPVCLFVNLSDAAPTITHDIRAAAVLMNIIVVNCPNGNFAMLPEKMEIKIFADGRIKSGKVVAA